MRLLSYAPDRLGHATFLDVAARDAVRASKMCIEICLSSNILFVAIFILRKIFPD